MTYSAEDPRRSPRSKVFLTATLECSGQTLPVVLRDLSEHGALIETEASLTEDSEVRFLRKDLRVKGYVAWVRGKYAGISFSSPLHAEIVLRHIGRPARPRQDVVHWRPAVARRGMSPEEQRWVEEMMRGPTRRTRSK